MYKAQVITALADMAPMQEEWNGLRDLCEAMTPYQSWEWNYSWLKSLGRKTSPFVVTIRGEDGKLVCIAPFELNRGCGGLVGSLGFISQKASIYPNLLMKRGEEELILRFLAGYLRNNSTVSAIELIVAEPTPTLRYLKTALDDAGWFGTRAVDYTKRLLIDMGNSYEGYLGTLSSKMRQEIRAEAKKLAKHHLVTFAVTDQYADLEQAMETLFYLNSLKWVGDPKKKHPERRECYRALHSNDGARIFLLSCDGRPVGGLSALLMDDTVFGEIAGFDFSIGKFDLGKIFYHHLFMWAEENGFQRIDFSSGEEPYKFRYNPLVLSKWNVVSYRNSNASRLIRVVKKIEKITNKIKKSLISNRIFRATGIVKADRKYRYNN